MKGTRLDNERLRNIILSDQPERDMDTIALWQTETTFPLLQEVLRQWDIVIAGSKPFIDNDIYHEAVNYLKRQPDSAYYAEGGTVGSVREFFKTHANLLSEEARTYLEQEILADPALDTFDSQDENYQLVHSAINELSEAAKAQIEYHAPVDLDKPEVTEKTAEPEPEPAQEESERATLQQEITGLQTALEFAEGTEADEIKELIAGIEVAMEFLPEEKAKGGGLTDQQIQLVSYTCDVTEDDFEEGAAMNITNSFSQKVNQRFNSPKDLFKYIAGKITFKDFDADDYQVSEDGALSCSILVDSSNYPADENDIKEWKAGNKKLYIADYIFNIELVTAKEATSEQLAEMLKVKFAKGGGLRLGYGKRTYNSPLIRYVNFNDGSYINIVRLTTAYADGRKYSVVYAAGATKDIFAFKTLEQAEKRFEQLQKERESTVSVKNKGVLLGNYEPSGQLPHNWNALQKKYKEQGYEVKLADGGKVHTPEPEIYTDEHGNEVKGYISTWNFGSGKFEGKPVVYGVQKSDFPRDNETYIVVSGIKMSDNELVNTSEAYNDWFASEQAALSVAHELATNENAFAEEYAKGGAMRNQHTILNELVWNKNEDGELISEYKNIKFTISQDEGKGLRKEYRLAVYNTKTGKHQTDNQIYASIDDAKYGAASWAAIQEGVFKYAQGGFVGKGELVWNKVDAGVKLDFLIKNFTPEITPRTQEDISKRAYNFVPKNVKIKWEAEYANKDAGEYAKGGGVGQEILNFDDYQVKIKYNPKFKRWEGLHRAIHPKTKAPLQKWGFDWDSEFADSKEELLLKYKNINSNNGPQKDLLMYVTGSAQDIKQFAKDFKAFAPDDDMEFLSDLAIQIDAKEVDKDVFEQMAKNNNLSVTYNTYAKGGHPARNLSRDRMFRSQQEWEKNLKRKTKAKKYKRALEHGGEAGEEKYYTVSLYFKDDPEEIIDGYTIKDGSLVEGEDDDIFFYATEADIKEMMKPDNDDYDFVVTKYELDDSSFAKGGKLQHPYAQGYKEIEGYRIVNVDKEFDDNPLFYMWSEYPVSKKLDSNNYLEFSYGFYTDKKGNRYLLVSDPEYATTEALEKIIAQHKSSGLQYERNVDDFVNGADKETYNRWLNLISKKGGHPARNLSRDRMFRSQQEWEKNLKRKTKAKKYKRALEHGGEAGEDKYYTVSLYFKDNPEEIIDGYTIKDGAVVEGEDDDIFFYATEADIKEMMKPDNDDYDFVVTKYELDDSSFARGGHPARNLSRDRMFRSQQEWEKNLNRKTPAKRYKKAAGGKAGRGKKHDYTVSPGKSFDLCISRALATDLLKHAPENITGECFIMCAEAAAEGKKWAKVDKKMLVQGQLPPKYKTFELWISGDITREQLQQAINEFKP